jgi:hypothetical protein
MKSRRPSRTGHETNVGRKTAAQEFWSGNAQEGQTLWRQKCNTEVHFKEIDGRMWKRLISLGKNARDSLF